MFILKRTRYYINGSHSDYYPALDANATGYLLFEDRASAESAVAELNTSPYQLAADEIKRPNYRIIFAPVKTKHI